MNLYVNVQCRSLGNSGVSLPFPSLGNDLEPLLACGSEFSGLDSVGTVKSAYSHKVVNVEIVILRADLPISPGPKKKF